MSPLAQALSKHRGKPAGADQVASWASGRRPIPEEVGAEMFHLRERIAADLRARADRVLAWPIGGADPDAPLSPLKDALTLIDAAARTPTPEEALAELVDETARTRPTDSPSPRSRVAAEAGPHESYPSANRRRR